MLSLPYCLLALLATTSGTTSAAQNITKKKDDGGGFLMDKALKASSVVGYVDWANYRACSKN